ncbi:MAG: nitronate monooxygenase [Caulobacteraceae bacterium]
MKSPVCEMLGIEFPLFALQPLPRRGGRGQPRRRLWRAGRHRHTADSVRTELKWIDDHVDGKPYGLDLLFPENMATAGESGGHLQLAEDPHPAGAPGLRRPACWPRPASNCSNSTSPTTGRSRSIPEQAMRTMEAAFEHPIKMIANALGVPPPAMLEMGKRHGVPVAALVGAKEHAIRQVNAGVDILVVQGTEAGGHCGEVTTMVLVPEVLQAIKKIRDVPVLAAGGIMNGRQMAACMAMGAAGVWTGSVWLATLESETSEIFREKMIEASSRDAVRVKTRTGKPARQLRSAWTEAWERSPNSPGALPMPLMSLVSENALRSAQRAAEGGNTKARDLVTYFVGQGVGLVDQVRGAGQVVQDFKAEFLEAVEHMNGLLEE